MITRQDIVDAARTCLGTPFRHCGRDKVLGLDCIGLLVSVCKDLSIPHKDVLNYSRVPDGSTLTLNISSQLSSCSDPSTGDVLVFWTARPSLPRHVAIIATPTRIIHTWSDVGKVVEHELDEDWQRRICGSYRFPGII